MSNLEIPRNFVKTNEDDPDIDLDVFLERFINQKFKELKDAIESYHFSKEIGGRKHLSDILEKEAYDFELLYLLLNGLEYIDTVDEYRNQISDIMKKMGEFENAANSLAFLFEGFKSTISPPYNIELSLMLENSYTCCLPELLPSTECVSSIDDIKDFSYMDRLCRIYLEKEELYGFDAVFVKGSFIHVFSFPLEFKLALCGDVNDAKWILISIEPVKILEEYIETNILNDYDKVKTVHLNQNLNEKIKNCGNLKVLKDFKEKESDETKEADIYEILGEFKGKEISKYRSAGNDLAELFHLDSDVQKGILQNLKSMFHNVSCQKIANFIAIYRSIMKINCLYERFKEIRELFDIFLEGNYTDFVVDFRVFKLKVFIDSKKHIVIGRLSTSKGNYVLEGDILAELDGQINSDIDPFIFFNLNVGFFLIEDNKHIKNKKASVKDLCMLEIDHSFIKFDKEFFEESYFCDFERYYSDFCKEKQVIIFKSLEDVDFYMGHKRLYDEFYSHFPLSSFVKRAYGPFGERSITMFNQDCFVCIKLNNLRKSQVDFSLYSGIRKIEGLPEYSKLSLSSNKDDDFLSGVLMLNESSKLNTSCDRDSSHKETQNRTFHIRYSDNELSISLPIESFVTFLKTKVDYLSYMHSLSMIFKNVCLKEFFILDRNTSLVIDKYFNITYRSKRIILSSFNDVLEYLRFINEVLSVFDDSDTERSSADSNSRENISNLDEHVPPFLHIKECYFQQDNNDAKIIFENFEILILSNYKLSVSSNLLGIQYLFEQKILSLGNLIRFVDNFYHFFISELFPNYYTTQKIAFVFKNTKKKVIIEKKKDKYCVQLCEKSVLFDESDPDLERFISGLRRMYIDEKCADIVGKLSNFCETKEDGGYLHLHMRYFVLKINRINLDIEIVNVVFDHDKNSLKRLEARLNSVFKYSWTYSDFFALNEMKNLKNFFTVT